MRSILWGAPYGGINTFPKSLVDLNYANFNAVSHCEIHRDHQENQRYSLSSQNLQSSAVKIPGKISQVKSLGRGCRNLWTVESVQTDRQFGKNLYRGSMHLRTADLVGIFEGV